MKRLLTLWIFSIVMTLTLTGNALADNPGAGQEGVFLSLGYTGYQLDYREIVYGSVLDKDTGYQNGAAGEIRFDTKHILTRVSVEYYGSESSKYTGALQNGTPWTMETPEWIFNGEGDVGYKVNIGNSTLTPYLGLGWHTWARGENKGADYKENYTWGYGAFGANWAVKIDRLMIALDGAVTRTLNPQMSTDVAGTIDSADFKLKPRWGYKFELPISYLVLAPEKGQAGPKYYISLIPHYEHWDLGQSNTVYISSGGTVIGSAYEPTSHTNIYGFKVMLTANF
jgi:hypothetical protein